MSDREQVAEELRRVRDAVRARAGLEPAALPAALPPREPDPMPPLPEAAGEGPPPRPDNAAVNEGWRITRALSGGGPRGLLARGLGRLLARVLGEQELFNAHQVKLDNALLEYVDRRFDHTHRQYDRVLGIHSRHMAEIDERHLILQEELVAHVHDLVRRIDLVLGRSERSRASLEHALTEIRRELARIEERLPAK